MTSCESSIQVSNALCQAKAVITCLSSAVICMLTLSIYEHYLASLYVVLRGPIT